MVNEKTTPDKPVADKPVADKPADKPAEKMVRCTVVSNYGNARPGDVITVTEREYNRLRKPRLDPEGEPIKGKWSYPVLISAEHQQKIEEEKRAEEEERARLNMTADSATTAKGWADFEREAREITAGRRRAEIEAAKRAETRELAEMEKAGGASAGR